MTKDKPHTCHPQSEPHIQYIYAEWLNIEMSENAVQRKAWIPHKSLKWAVIEAYVFGNKTRYSTWIKYYWCEKPPVWFFFQHLIREHVCLLLINRMTILAMRAVGFLWKVFSRNIEWMSGIPKVEMEWLLSILTVKSLVKDVLVAGINILGFVVFNSKKNLKDLKWNFNISSTNIKRRLKSIIPMKDLRLLASSKKSFKVGGSMVCSWMSCPNKITLF